MTTNCAVTCGEHTILLTGWSPENVGRVSGIFHETRISQDLPKFKEGTGGTDAEKSKFNFIGHSIKILIKRIIQLCSHALPSIFYPSSSP